MSALLEVEELQVTFGRTAAVRGASFRVEKGETHCLVGESGCGKSVTALAVMNLLARGGQRSAKRMSFGGTDLATLSDREMARLRGNRMAMIFQEPMTSLNPAFTIGSQMAEVMTRHKGGSRAAALDRAAELMGRVGITAPGMRLGQFPHQLSGGLRQLGDVCRRGGGACADLRTVPRAAASLYARTLIVRAGAGPRPARQAARLYPGHRAGDRHGLCRLRLSLALRPCRRELRAGHTAAAGGRGA
jgi:ABC-type lipoprotein export system ATPase subunit